MNGNINKEAIPVTSVGNAWVICNSKSRPGFIYYFNTLSGQAVWNLSAEEIEKAKKFTKALPISEIEKCPEPTMDPPMEAWAQQSGQQYLNGQATRQPPPPTPNMLPMNLFNNLGLTATPNNMVGLPTNINMQGVPANINMPELPTNINNTPGLTANLNNMPQMPAVLNNLPQMPANLNNMPQMPAVLNNLPQMPANLNNMPQMPAVLNNLPQMPANLNNMPQMPAVLNNLPQMPANLNNMPQIQANLNNLLGQNMTGLNPFMWNTGNNQIQTQPVIYIVAQQPAGIPVQQMPQNVPPQDVSYNNSNQTEETPATANQGFNRSRIDLDDNKLDLRHKLTRKRCKSESQDSSYCKMATDQPVFSQERKQNFLSTNTVQEKSSKFDLSLLNKLKPSGSTLLIWLIVADIEMILQNFAFLNKLTDPDQNCYLMVPDHVMDYLEQLVDEGPDKPTRRILRFLKEQIEQELAFRADEVKDSTDSRYKLYATCKALAERNNVVLLSDDPSLDEYKNDHINIHVFKLQELNHFLTKSNRRRSRAKSPTLNIKIHVPNDKHCRGEKERRQTRSPFIFNQVANSGGGNIQPATSSATNRVPEKTNPQLPKKKETDSFQAQDLESVENIRIHNASHEPQTSRATLLTQNSTDEVYSHTVPDKTAEPIKHETNSLSQSSANDRSRHIVLCRNRQSTSNTENNDRQSKYRWRKKTTAPNSEAPKTSEQSSQMEPQLSQEEPISEEQQHDTNVMENIPIPDISPARERSEQSSISSFLPPPDRPNIIIEETSTSGIISNSSEIDIILRKNSVSSSAKETASACDAANFIRYQVVGQTMEEVLRTRREEWVLRFVQIMEEALKDTLRVSLPSETENNYYTASWATDLPDLALCIIKKLSHHYHVVDAANRLYFTLYRISDKKGNVCANLEPRQYMEMYSYGVYLIESLKQVMENCDDLTASAECLKKLMFDIQNANQEYGHKDTFMDKLTFDENIVTRTDVNTPRSPLVRSISNVEKGSLNSDLEKASLHPQFSNMESNFFSHLSLTRISSDRSLHTPSSTPNSARLAPSQISSPKTPASPKITPNVIAGQATTASNVTEDSKKSEDEKSNKDAKETPVPTNTNTTEIKIVRKFVNIPQLEEKLDKIQNENYSIDNEDNYEMDDEYYDENEIEDGELQEQEEEEKEVNNSEDASKDAGANSKMLIKDFVREIMSPIGLVKEMCEKMMDDLKNSRKPSLEMQRKLESSLSSIKLLENTLQRIIEREETTEKNKDIASLLKTASLHSNVPDKDLYKRTIKDCLKIVSTYHYLATQVVAACKQQVT